MSKFKYTIRCKDCQRYSTATDEDGCELNCPKCMSERLIVIYKDAAPEPEDEDRACDEWKDNIAMGYEV
ncbi:Uncharacterised protein [Streptococcus suis]|nr:hypothetical protein phiS10_0014 [Streptococcus phage phiS10]QOE30787.1 hypothetical protein SSU10_01398 [Streptococcus suis]CYY98469.1 Uncharacterised protein [Streptococcus suis]CYZ72014.1 Uncharacterised protein [Streptococcus suis]CYZ83926.1 Uncharacterised protein [Streptococcus suis]